jgi:hypothetical protein
LGRPISHDKHAVGRQFPNPAHFFLETTLFSRRKLEKKPKPYTKVPIAAVPESLFRQRGDASGEIVCIVAHRHLPGTSRGICAKAAAQNI